MNKVIFEKLLILGVGLIGGSLAMAAKQAGAVGEVRGWGRRQCNVLRPAPRLPSAALGDFVIFVVCYGCLGFAF